VDEPVLLALPRLEEGVAALQPLAVEGEHDLARLPLVQLVGAGVPDRHLAGAVVALRDLALERQVLERVILRVDRLAVVVGILRYSVRYGPRGERAVVLEPQVPVEPRGVVLLDDEARAVRIIAACAGTGLRRLAEVALLLVVAELAHPSRRISAIRFA
jgi:hypothetical protein